MFTAGRFWQHPAGSFLAPPLLACLVTAYAVPVVLCRVLERYPHNGKVLKIWGRFQEWVLHDPGRAQKSYTEALKRGVGESLLSLASERLSKTGVN